MDLKEAQARVDAWISQFEEGYWPPMHNLACLVEEMGELARILNHLYGSKPKRAEEPEQDLAQVFFDGALLEPELAGRLAHEGRALLGGVQVEGIHVEGLVQGHQHVDLEEIDQGDRRQHSLSRLPPAPQVRSVVDVKRDQSADLARDLGRLDRRASAGFLDQAQ